MTLVAFDQSTVKFGVCVGGQGDERPRTFVIRGPGADEMVIDKMLSDYSRAAYELVRIQRAERCLIEAPLMLADRSAHTAMALIQLTGAVRAAAHRAGARVTLVAVSTVRRHFIGTGNMKGPDAKRATIARCRELGWQVEDDNAADAAALWSYGMSLYYPRWAANATPLFAERERA